MILSEPETLENLVDIIPEVNSQPYIEIQETPEAEQEALEEATETPEAEQEALEEATETQEAEQEALEEATETPEPEQETQEVEQETQEEPEQETQEAKQEEPVEVKETQEVEQETQEEPEQETQEEPEQETQEPEQEEQEQKEPEQEEQELIDEIPEASDAEIISMTIKEPVMQKDKIDLNIPKYIFQTHKSMAYVYANKGVQRSINQWKQFTSPKYNYRYFFNTDAMCESFVRNNFPSDVYQAYSKLPMGVMKADLWRYCIIYHYGGIYVDTDTEPLAHPNIFTSPKTLLICGPENQTHLSQWFFAAPKHSPILKRIIEFSVKRILETQKIQGEHIIHYLTGPGCFTDAIEDYLREHNLPTFDNKLQYETYRNEVMCVFNGQTYRNKLIKHHFAGQKPGGWIQERNRKLL